MPLLEDQNPVWPCFPVGLILSPRLSCPNFLCCDSTLKLSAFPFCSLYLTFSPLCILHVANVKNTNSKGIKMLNFSWPKTCT